MNFKRLKYVYRTIIILNDYQIYYLKCNVVGISNLKSCPSLRGTRTFSKEKVRRGFLTYRIAINRTTRGKPLRLQKTSFFDWPRKARHSFGKLKLSSSQTLLITQCPLQEEECKFLKITNVWHSPSWRGTLFITQCPL